MKINRDRLIHEYYQVSKPAKFPWRGIPLDDSTKKEDKIKRENRKIELSPNDILIKSCNGKFYNKINKNGAANIEIPEGRVKKVVRTVFFDDAKYKKGILNPT